MDGLNNFRISGLQFTYVTFSIFNVFIDLVNNKAKVLLFDERVFFQKFRLNHLACLNEDGSRFENVINFVDSSSGEVSTDNRCVLELEIPVD